MISIIMVATVVFGFSRSAVHTRFTGFPGCHNLLQLPAMCLSILCYFQCLSSKCDRDDRLPVSSVSICGGAVIHPPKFTIIKTTLSRA